MPQMVALYVPFPAHPWPATPDNLRAARAFVMAKWRERARELGLPDPDDLSGSCRFSSMFAQGIFGGELQGNPAHQFVRLDGEVLDLNADARDVRERRAEWEAAQRKARIGRRLDGREWHARDPHAHDRRYWWSMENQEALRRCKPRVDSWTREFIVRQVLPRAA